MKAKTVGFTAVNSNRVEVFVGSDLEKLKSLARKAASRIMNAGETVRWRDGTKEWINVCPEMEENDDGTHSYVVHEDNGKIKCGRTHKKMTPDGTITWTELRPSWRSAEKVFAE